MTRISSRKRERLGWEDYEAEEGKFIATTLTIDGHHFSIFEDQHVSFTAAQL